MTEAQPLKPLYINYAKLIHQPRTLFRQNASGKRYYYYVSDEGEFLSYPSVTSILSATMTTSPWLIKWIAEFGFQEAEKKKNKQADYGTLMHICLSDFLIHKKFDFGTLPARIYTFKQSKHIDYDTTYWAQELEKDIYAFHAFAAQYNVKPLAIGIMLVSNELGFAGELDLVVEMTIGTGQNGKVLKTDIKLDKNSEIVIDKRRVITAIMDWKSGRNGFYAQNEAQLHMYKALWDENYPHCKVDALYNWSPKEWNDEPDWNFKDQTASSEGEKIQHYLNIFKIDDAKRKEKIFPEVNGIIELGIMNGNLRTETFEQRAKRLHGRALPKQPDKVSIRRPFSKEREMVTVEEAERFEKLNQNRPPYTLINDDMTGYKGEEPKFVTSETIIFNNKEMDTVPTGTQTIPTSPLNLINSIQDLFKG